MSNIAIMQTQLAQKKSPNFPNCTRKTLNCKVNTAWWTPPDRIRRSQNCSRTQLPLLVHRKSLQHLISNYMVIPENGAIAPSSSSSSSYRNERFNFLWNSPFWPSVVARKNRGRDGSWADSYRNRLLITSTLCQFFLASFTRRKFQQADRIILLSTCFGEKLPVNWSCCW